MARRTAVKEQANGGEKERDLSATGDELLHRLAVRVRALRQERGQSRRELAERAGLSERFLALVEGGQGNPSLRSLCEIAAALETTPVALIEPSNEIVALLGLRGAGKSTVGRAVAKRLRRPFVELDALVEQAAGLSLSEIWEIHGESYYRRVEREELLKILESGSRAVVATSGGIVAEPSTWERLRQRAVTVWLSATPEDHWERVVAQGDHRPMANDPLAMERLRQLLAEREALYKQADYTVPTSGCSVLEVVDRVLSIVQGQ